MADPIEVHRHWEPEDADKCEVCNPNANPEPTEQQLSDDLERNAGQPRDLNLMGALKGHLEKVAGQCTPTPWSIADENTSNSIAIVGDGKELVSTYSDDDSPPEDWANARHIVRCVNSHAGLVAALEPFAKHCDSPGFQDIKPDHLIIGTRADCERARKALADARGER